MEPSEDRQDMDYTGLVIKDMYEILTTHKTPWPVKYTKYKKLEFLDKMLLYLKENQMYEMCAGIQKMKEDILNESAIQGKATKNK